jgi:hypothetical protein
MSPAQGARLNASACPESLPPLADRVQVERRGGRLFVIITRTYPRLVGLSDDEARYLAGLLNAETSS